jgi:hypothetical protein
MVLHLKNNQPPTFYAFSEFGPFSQALTTLRHYFSWHIIRELPCESVIKIHWLVFRAIFHETRLIGKEVTSQDIYRDGERTVANSFGTRKENFGWHTRRKFFLSCSATSSVPIYTFFWTELCIIIHAVRNHMMLFLTSQHLYHLVRSHETDKEFWRS